MKYQNSDNMDRPLVFEAIALAAEEYKKELLRINGVSLLPLDDPAKLRQHIIELMNEKIASRLLMSTFGRGFILGFLVAALAITQSPDEQESNE